MDGPIFRTGRILTIEFKADRSSQDRLELAYHRFQTVDSVVDPPKNRLDVGLLNQLATPHLILEIHG